MAPFARFSVLQLLEWVKVRRQSETLDAIGESLGVSKVAVHQWLTGERNPSSTVLILSSLMARNQSGSWPLE